MPLFSDLLICLLFHNMASISDHISDFPLSYCFPTLTPILGARGVGGSHRQLAWICSPHTLQRGVTETLITSKTKLFYQG